jgi:poly(beta-D-mannuronate) lyase
MILRAGKAHFLALAALLAISTASSKDHPVSNRQEFENALASIQPGDAIVLKNGGWREVQLNFRARGEEGKPVTLRAETAGSAVLESSSELVIDGPHLVVSGLKFQNNSNLTQVVTPYNVTVRRVVRFTEQASHCRLTETAILNSGPGVTTYVHLEPGGRSNRVDHCFFSNPGEIGVTFYVEAHPTRVNGHLIDSNYFGDRKRGTGNRWETIRIGHAEQQNFVSATTIASNYFYRCNGEIECISNKSTGNRFLYNAFIENQGQLTLRHGDKAWIEGNYFFGGNESGSQGLRISGSDHVVINNYFKGVRDAIQVYNGQSAPQPTGYTPVNNTLIACNTLEDCANNLVLGVGGTGRGLTPRNLRIAYNIVQGTSGNIIQNRSSGIDVHYKGNVMFGANLGMEDHAGISRQRPALVTDQWGRILPDAAQLDVRVNLEGFPQIQKDLNGEARAESSNVGAIGVRSARPIYPLSRQDVGPRWMK